MYSNDSTRRDRQAATTAVRLGWQLVDAYERLGIAEAERLFDHELRAWFDHAKRTVPNLEPWPSAVTSLPVYENEPNRLRYRRVLDFVRSGDRIFDIGFGAGYLCGVLLRDGKVESYRGIDIVEENLQKAQEMLTVNRFDGADVDFEIDDLYELTRARVAEGNPTLLICCEVLEHVPDADRALAVLADCLPEDSDLLISVPLYGRLESVWGHKSVFDSARLRRMFDDVGLHVHHAEPLANLWSLVIASHNSTPSERIMHAKWRPADVVAPLTEARNFADVPPSEVSAVVGVRGMRGTCEKGEYGRTICRLETEPPLWRRRSTHRGAFGFPVPGVASFRIELALIDGIGIDQLSVHLKGGDQLIASWLWKLRPASRRRTSPVRLFFRPDSSSSFLVPEVSAADFSRADRVDVVAEVSGEKSVAFTMRAAYLP